MTPVVVALALSGLVFLILAAVLGAARDNARMYENAVVYGRGGFASLGAAVVLFLAAIWTGALL